MDRALIGNFQEPAPSIAGQISGEGDPHFNSVDHSILGIAAGAILRTDP